MAKFGARLARGMTGFGVTGAFSESSKGRLRALARPMVSVKDKAAGYCA